MKGPGPLKWRDPRQLPLLSCSSTGASQHQQAIIRRDTKLLRIMEENIMTDDDCHHKSSAKKMSDNFEQTNTSNQTTNKSLQNKYENHDFVVEECNRLKSEMDKIKINLCLALDRKFNDKEDIMHLINVCAALAPCKNEYNYISKENDKLKSKLSNYDEIQQSVEKLKEELYIKDLKISQLKDDICSINKEKNIQLQVLHDNLAEFPEKFIDQSVHGAFDCSQNNNELYEGKMLIAEHINQIKGTTDFESENHKLCDLINMLARLTADKEEHLKTINRCLIENIEDKNQQLIKEIDDQKKWQKHLESENEKLNSEFEGKKLVQQMLICKENELKKLIEDYAKMQLMYDELDKKNGKLTTLLDEYRQLLADRKIKCVDNDNLIKTLQLNLKEQTNKCEIAIAKYKNEKEKCQKNETYTKQMVDEFTDCLGEKEINIALVRSELNDLKQHIKSEEDYIGNLKHEVMTLGNALDEKNKIIQEMSKAQSKQQQQHTATLRSSSLISDDQLHIISKLEEQMDQLLDSCFTWNKTIVGYEKVLFNIQNSVQQQFKKINYRVSKHQHLKDIEYKLSLTENLTKEKEVIIFQLQNEMEDIKEIYNSKITHMEDTEVNLRNEIFDLKKSLKLKSLHIMIAEKIASLQLKASLTTIEQLTNTCNIQSLKLNDTQNKMLQRCCDTRVIKTNYRYQQMKDLVDHNFKLNSENKIMKKLCKIREEKIMSLENSPCRCTYTCRPLIRKY